MSRAFVGELTECRSFSIRIADKVVHHESGVFLEGKDGFSIPQTKVCKSEKEAVVLYWQLVTKWLQEGYTEVFSIEDAMAEDKPVMPAPVHLPDFHDLPKKEIWFRPWQAENIRRVGLMEVFASGRGKLVEYPVGFPVLFVKEAGVFDVYSQEMTHTGLMRHLPLVQLWTSLVGQIIPDRTMIMANVIPLEDAQVSHRLLLGDPDKACNEQDRKGYLGLYPYDILVWADVPVAQLLSYEVRLNTLIDITQSVESRSPTTGLEHALIGGAGYKTKEVYRMNFEETPAAVLEPQTIHIHTGCNNIPKLLRERDVSRCLVFDPTQPFKGCAWSTRGVAPHPPFVGLWREVAPRHRRQA